jgi:hypothetical protein
VREIPVTKDRGAAQAELRQENSRVMKRGRAALFYAAIEQDILGIIGIDR